MGYDYTYDGHITVDEDKIAATIKALVPDEPVGPRLVDELAKMIGDVGALQETPESDVHPNKGTVTYNLHGSTRAHEELGNMLHEIAPTVQEAFIECEGEDRYNWLYRIQDHTLEEISGEVVYEDEHSALLPYRVTAVALAGAEDSTAEARFASPHRSETYARGLLAVGEHSQVFIHDPSGQREVSQD